MFGFVRHFRQGVQGAVLCCALLTVSSREDGVRLRPDLKEALASELAAQLFVLQLVFAAKRLPTQDSKQKYHRRSRKVCRLNVWAFRVFKVLCGVGWPLQFLESCPRVQTSKRQGL